MLNSRKNTCKNAENASATADIEDDLVLEYFRVVDDGPHIGLGADGVLEHFLVDGEVRIPIEVVVAVFDIAHVGLPLLKLHSASALIFHHCKQQSIYAFNIRDALLIGEQLRANYDDLDNRFNNIDFVDDFVLY